MSEENDLPDDERPDLKGRLSGAAQFIIGEIETIGGVLTGDPLTQAEGEFNVEIGTVRDEIEAELNEDDEDANPLDVGRTR